MGSKPHQQVADMHHYAAELSADMLRRMHIKAIPMRWGAGDNYCYLVRDDATKITTLIDPASPAEVLPVIRNYERQGSKLETITNTHHHFDHSGGNETFYTMYPGLKIIAGKNSPLVSITPAHGSQYRIGKNILVTAWHTPCHTRDSICYYMKDNVTGEQAVFTGDTLFNAGCGRFFEGTPSEMYHSLHKLAELPRDTPVYPGHEYTKSNAHFARQVLDNDAIKKLVEYCDTHEKTTGVFSIADELGHNPFMQCDDVDLQKRVRTTGPIECMAKLRQMKNEM